MKIGLFFLGLVLSGMFLSCRKTIDTQVDELVDIGTHSLYLRCMGQGRVTVVIDNGVGDSSERWMDFQNQVAQFSHVCTYDRAGYGASDSGPLPRNSQQSVVELEQLLHNAGLEGPFLLVGHSLGGINLQVFADQYPEKVVGLILLDPSPIPFIKGEAFPALYRMFESQALELKTLAEEAGKATDPEGQQAAKFLDMVASEHASLITESADQVAAIESFGDLPLVVIGSGVPNPGFGDQAAAFQQFWIEENQKLSEKSTNGQFILAEESSHYLHEDAPEVILDAIRELISGID